MTLIGFAVLAQKRIRSAFQLRLRIVEKPYEAGATF